MLALILVAQTNLPAHALSVIELRTLCGAASGLKLSGDEAQISIDEGESYRLKNAQGNLEIYKGGEFFGKVEGFDFDSYVDCIERMGRNLTRNDIYRPKYSEPTEGEMRRALEEVLTDRGMRASGDSYSTFGMTITIFEFRKQDCRVSPRGSGYLCSYLISTGMRSDIGGQDNAFNLLMGLLGGQRSPLHVQSRNFSKTGNVWYVSGV